MTVPGQLPSGAERGSCTSSPATHSAATMGSAPGRPARGGPGACPPRTGSVWSGSAREQRVCVGAMARMPIAVLDVVGDELVRRLHHRHVRDLGTLPTDHHRHRAATADVGEVEVDEFLDAGGGAVPRLTSSVLTSSPVRCSAPGEVFFYRIARACQVGQPPQPGPRLARPSVSGWRLRSRGAASAGAARPYSAGQVAAEPHLYRRLADRPAGRDCVEDVHDQ
jgi:hypothetical protein